MNLDPPNFNPTSHITQLKSVNYSQLTDKRRVVFDDQLRHDLFIVKIQGQGPDLWLRRICFEGIFDENSTRQFVDDAKLFSPDKDSRLGNGWPPLTHTARVVAFRAWYRLIYDEGKYSIRREDDPELRGVNFNLTFAIEAGLFSSDKASRSNAAVLAELSGKMDKILETIVTKE